MAVYLLRHGETASNAARIVQTPEIPLSERGLAQAERLAARLAREGIAAIVSSDLARARMTAERIAAASRLAIEWEPLLAERNYGDIRGTPYADLGARGIDIFAPDYAPAGGETWEVFHARVDRAWQRVEALAARTRGHLAVVTHGLVKHSLVARRLAAPGARESTLLGFGNTSVTIVEGPPWAVRLLGCTAHLAQETDG